MPSRSLIALALAALVGVGAIAGAAGSADEPSPKELVDERGARVMPFSLEATTHVFDARARGGTQRVVVKDDADARQIRLVREHLREEAAAFGRGDFADPAAIHGEDMPGLDALRAGHRDVEVRYRDLPDGAEISYGTDRPQLVRAVHAWFEAQLRDHGADATSSDHSSHPGHED